MSAPTYLVKSRNQIYYFRFVIPKDLQHHFPNHKREIRKSLKTRNRSHALQEARKLWVAMKTNIEYVNQFEAEIDDLEEGLRLFSKLENAEKLANYKNNSQIVDDFFANLSKREEKQLQKAIEHQNGLEQEVSLEEYKKSKFDDLHAQSLINESSLKEISNTLHQLLAVLSTNRNDNLSIQGDANEKGLPLEKVIEKFLVDKQLNIDNQKTLDTYEQNCKLFSNILGNPYANEIEAKHIVKFKEVLLKLPKNINKIPNFKGKTIDEIVALGTGEKLSQTTIKNIISRIKSFLTWGNENYHFQLEFAGILKEVGKKAKNDNEYRSVFTVDDLEKMFSTVEYQNDCFRNYPFRYWLPLLGLYTGCRLNELSQLYIDDIDTLEEIHVISINNKKDKKVKNKSSKRFVPIHKKLIELGFLDYVEIVKKNNEERLFPQLTKDSYGSYTRKISRFFNDDYKGFKGYITYAEIDKKTDEGKKDFHSFRHTFMNAGKQLGLNERILKEIGGYSSDDITFDTYGKNYGLQTKKKEIDKIRFDVKHPRKWERRFYGK